VTQTPKRRNETPKRRNAETPKCKRVGQVERSETCRGVLKSTGRCRFGVSAFRRFGVFTAAFRRFGVFALVALPSGCSYSSSRPFPDDVQTIYVDMFHSRDFRRDLEFGLTEAVQKRIVMDTPYRIADRQTADTVLSGEILGISNRTLGSDARTGLPRETGSTMTLALRWQDMRSGDILLERERFVVTTTYIPPAKETFTKGWVRGLDRVAEYVVEAMETDW